MLFQESFVRKASGKHLSFAKLKKVIEGHPRRTALMLQGVQFFLESEFPPEGSWQRMKRNFLNYYLPELILLLRAELHRVRHKRSTQIRQVDKFLEIIMEMYKSGLIVSPSLPQLAYDLKVGCNLPLTLETLLRKIKLVKT